METVGCKNVKKEITNEKLFLKG